MMLLLLLADDNNRPQNKSLHIKPNLTLYNQLFQDIHVESQHQRHAHRPCIILII